MDSKRFDAFTRAMDLTRTRRGAFGAIAAALSALTAPELTDARKHRRKR